MSADIKESLENRTLITFAATDPFQRHSCYHLPGADVITNDRIWAGPGSRLYYPFWPGPQQGLKFLPFLPLPVLLYPATETSPDAPPQFIGGETQQKLSFVLQAGPFSQAEAVSNIRLKDCISKNSRKVANRKNLLPTSFIRKNPYYLNYFSVNRSSCRSMIRH